MNKLKFKKVRVRVAPSPTGYLHLGTARTALFNYLFARQQGGQMFLRIEDTDQKRSQKKFSQEIIQGLKWLGLDWNGDIVYQSDRLKIYERYVAQLLKNGQAYEADGAIWFKVASVGLKSDRLKFTDLIRGPISFPIHKIKDFVIVTSDKMPLFLLTNVVDDYEMKISHVIRGEDHISNTPRQILLQKVLDLPTPRYAHLPLILAADKSKLSKRVGAVSILEFQKKGILAQALVNFLALLGFHPQGNQEIFDLPELVKIFDLKRVQKAGAIFNQEKLLDINRIYIKNMPDEKLAKMLRDFSRRSLTPQQLNRFIAIAKERMNTLADFDQTTEFLVKLSDYPSERLIFHKSTQPDSQKGLTKVFKALKKLSANAWPKEPALRKVLEKVATDENLSNGDVFWPTRVALSGLENSPQPSEILWALGKQESLNRILSAQRKLR